MSAYIRVVGEMLGRGKNAAKQKSQDLPGFHEIQLSVYHFTILS
jgi:hypothetical protein